MMLRMQFLLVLTGLYFQSVTIFAASLPADHIHTPLENVAISCGSAGNSTASNGRIWVGDIGTQSSVLLQLNGKSTKSRVTGKDTLIDSTPYETARISHHEFTYTFTQMKAGQKFIRLHFYPAKYKGFKKSRALFTVKAGPYTLLHNFRASLFESGASGIKYVSKEFCVNLEENQDLSISFSPSPKTRGSDNIYAFVNGIEIVSMPAGLYFTRDGDLGPPFVGQKYRFYIDNSTALEMIQRLTVGGNSIPSVEDPIMYRAWDEDLSYLSKPGGVPIRRIIPISYLHAPSYVAPAKVYQTARSMAPLNNLKESNLTWQIPVDLGFRYLLRLHFCELEFGISEDGDSEFSIFINNQVVESNANVIKWGGKHGVAVYRDYVVPMDGDRIEGKRYLNITLQTKFVSSDKTNNAILNGLEIFKLSNPDNNLAGPSPTQLLHSSKSWIPESQRKLSIDRKNAVATAVTIIIMLLNTAVYYLRNASESNSAARNKRISFSGILSRQFSLNEIQSTTNNFNSDCLIGSGGYGRVYKGSIDGGAITVAIKRLKSESRQGENEFWTEIKMLSKVRHEHLVPLIGYCNEGKEMLLVYEYMPRGTLADHLYKIGRSGVYNPPLSWGQRLKISVGAARGLYFLHKHRVIHRDVKSSNILVDENWEAKISDFGLSKMGPANDSFTHISTNIKGTFGYLDPEYYLTHRLTRKSDVYAFGVVLFEVLSSRPAIDIRLEEEQHGLASWARYCIRKRKIEQVIDKKLKEQISPACLKVFVGIAGRCIHNHPHERPSMSDIVMSLELALSLQQNPASTEQEEEEVMNVARSYSDQSDGVGSFEDLPVNPSNGEIENNVTKDPGAGSRTKEDDRLKNSRKENNSTSGSVSKWWWGPFGFLPKSPSKSKASPSLIPSQNQKLLNQEGLRQFSGQEIRRATNNFHDGLVVSFGGANNAYKGLIDGGQRIVVIRRSSATEIRLWMAQSKIDTGLSRRHPHVVSLIGYCNEEPDTVLVYDYMANGTLHDHLYDPNKNPLPWKHRLQICIGAARGLFYLQSAVKNTILHRSFKSVNIFLDENWVAKVSYFELSGRKSISVVPTIVGGNLGYLDSDYIRDEQLTEKSYVFSFGLVLFEVLCAPKDLIRWLDEDQVSLVQWIKSGIRSNFSGRIDPNLMHDSSPECLGMFIETASKCLLDKGTERPSMNEIVASLEAALLVQEAADGSRGY